MSYFDAPSFNDGLTTDYGLSTVSIGATAVQSTPVTPVTKGSNMSSLGFSQGWDMTDVSPIYGGDPMASFSTPTQSSVYTAAAQSLNNTGITASFGTGAATAATGASTDPAQSTNKAMLYLAAAGVLLAMAGFFKGK